MTNAAATACDNPACAGELSNGVKHVESCSMALGVLGRLQCRQHFRWYPFWFLATFLLDTAEELEESFTQFLGAEAVEQEVHALCCHALDVLGSGCIATYRFASSSRQLACVAALARSPCKVDWPVQISAALQATLA
jgi:hypothetical protein